MHRSEALDLVSCLSCGAEVSLGVDRVFAVTEESALCFACAIRRGGSYNEAHDSWTKSPNLHGLRELAAPDL
jgi:hypothetical protein